MHKIFTRTLLIFCFVFAATASHAQLIVAADDSTICTPGASVTLYVQTAPSYGTSTYTVDAIPFSSEVHAGTNAIPSGSDDINSSAISLGFSFCFFGNTYTQCYISTNGWVSFTNPPGTWNTVYGPGPAPAFYLPNISGSVPKNCIMGPWQDWYPNGDATAIKYQTLGTSPYRRFVVSFHNIQMFGVGCYGATLGSFQIVLYETTNVIDNHIIAKPSCTGWEGNLATQALHNSTGTVSVEAWSRDATSWTTTNESTRFTPTGVSWTAGATAVGTGDTIVVTPAATTTYTATLTACDGTIYTDDVTIFVDPVDASFDYAAGLYCTTGTATPTVTGSPGGTFTISPATATIDPVTGTVDLATATPGAYTVTYTTAAGLCPVESATDNFNIVTYPDAGFGYSASTFCPSGIIFPSFITTSGGSFSASPAGLSVNASTGAIDLSTATVGTTYTISYTVGVVCPATGTFDITITQDDPSFSYSAASYCPSGTTSPTSITTPGGTFSVSPAGLTVNASTGTIDLTTGTPGITYTITYTTPAGPCSHSTTQTVHIDPLDDAGFGYSAVSYCPTGTTATVFVNTPGGSFTVSPAGLSVDPATGTIDLTTGTPGTTYTITYNTPPGPCSNVSTEDVHINPLDEASFSYASPDFCPTGSASPTTIATAGGTFSITPAGLVINAATGTVDLSTGTPGTTYTITYTTPAGPCSNSSTQTITIDALLDAAFSYPDIEYCATGSILPLSVTNPGGNFTAPAGVIITPASGSIDLAASTPGGPYNIVYTSPGLCGESDTFQLTIFPNPVVSLVFDNTACIETPAVPLTGTPPGGTYSGYGVVDSSFIPSIPGVIGTYSLGYSYTDINGCTSAITEDITVLDSYVDAGTDVVILEGADTNLLATGPGIIWSWTPPDGLSCTDCPNPIANPLTTTTYTVTTTDVNGCTASDDVTVTVSPYINPEVFVPNAFTPNGDNINDFFFVYGPDVTMIYSMTVFDRWGEILFHSENIPAEDSLKGWDGTYGKKAAPAGVYAYLIDVQLKTGAHQIEKGNVTLLR